MRYAELRLYNSAGTATTILPDYSNLQASTLYNDVGAINFTYPLDRAITLGLTDAKELGLVIDGVERERYFIENTTTVHSDDGALLRELQGRSNLAYMEDAIVYPQNWPVTQPAGHDFVDATPGTVLRTLIQHAKTIGYLSQIDETSFTGALTTDGVAWTKTQTINYANGSTLLQAIQDMVTRGLCDVKMVGRQLRVYNYGFLAVHRTTVVVRRAHNITEASSASDSREFASTVLIEGDNNVMQEVNDAPAVAAVRKRAKYVSQGGITDAGTLTLLAQAELDSSKNIKNQVTLGISVQDGTPQPWVDFSTGEWIYVDRDSQVQELQVKQISVGVDENRTIQVGLAVGDLLDDAEEKLRRKIDAITGGNSGTYGPLPNPNLPDLLAPAAPVSVSLTPNSYQDSNGRTFAQVTISWPPVTTNSDGSALDDLEGYGVEYWLTTTGQWSAAGIVTASPQYVSQLPPGAAFQARVRTIDKNGNASAFTNSSTITLPNDVTAPPTPSTPVVQAYLGQLRISWDGLGSAAQAMPIDFEYTEVHLSTTNGFSPVTGTIIGSMRAAGQMIATDLTYGTTYYVKLIARDKSGNASAASAQASGVPERVSGIDIAAGTISFDQLAFKDDGNLVPDGSFESVTMRALRLTGQYAGNWASNGGTFGNTAGNRFHGEFYMQWAPVSGGPVQTNYLTPQSPSGEEVLVRPASKIFVRFAARGLGSFSGGSTASINGRVRYNDGTFTDHSFATVSSMSTSWQEASATFTVPANAASMTFYASTSGLAAGNILTDAYEIRNIIGTALIEDAAITNAKIQNLAVDDAKVANLAVGKLTAGTLSADVTISSRIATALSGSRMEMNSTGLHAFNGGGTETATIGSDGAVYIQGTLDGGSLRMPSFFTSASGMTSIDSSTFSVNVDNTINLVTNPSFETYSGVVPTGLTNGPSSTGVVSKGPLTTDFKGNKDNLVKFGKVCLKVSASATNGYVEITGTNLAPSTRYRFSFYSAFGMVNEASSPPFENGYANFQNIQVVEVGGLARILAQSVDSGLITEGVFKGLPLTISSGSSSPQSLGALGWSNRWQKDFTTPANLVAGGAVKIRLPAYVSVAGVADATKALFFDGLQIEAKSYMTMYCDGDQSQCTWAGTAHASTSSRPAYSPMWFSYSDGLIVEGKASFSDVVVRNSLKLGSGSPHGSNYVSVARSSSVVLSSGVWTVTNYDVSPTADRLALDDGQMYANQHDFISQSPGIYTAHVAFNWGSSTIGNRYLRIVTQGGTILALVEGPANLSTVWSLSATAFLPGSGYFINVQQQQTAGGNIATAANAPATPSQVTFVQVA